MDFLNLPITTNWMMAFVIGLLSFFPSMVPTALSIKKTPSYEMYNKAKLENKMLYLPIIYGLLNVLVFYLVSRVLPSQYQRYWVIGAIFGLIYPTLGVIGGLPQNVME